MFFIVVRHTYDWISVCFYMCVFIVFVCMYVYICMFIYIYISFRNWNGLLFQLCYINTLLLFRIFTRSISAGIMIFNSRIIQLLVNSLVFLVLVPSRSSTLFWVTPIVLSYVDGIFVFFWCAGLYKLFLDNSPFQGSDWIKCLFIKFFSH